MPNRVVREALRESDRWLGLPHPVERLAYVVLLLIADDLGTLDASDGQLVRMWRDACNIKGREDALRILDSLVEADLVRTYEDGDKRFVFIPRFRQRFRAKSIRRPTPPESLLRDEPAIAANIREIKEHLLGMPVTSRPGAGHPTGSGTAPAPVVEGVVVVEGAPSPLLAKEKGECSYGSERAAA